MKSAGILAGTMAGLVVLTTVALGDDFVYSPVNPSFGGNPLNSAHLLGLANAQRTATASDAKKESGGGGGTPGESPGNSDIDLFIRQLQGRLLSALASQVTDAIFGEDPQDSGTIQFGDTTVTFERTLEYIRLVITDPTGTTEIKVPQLVTGTDSALNASLFSGTSLGVSGNLVTPAGGASLSQSLGAPLNSTSLGGGLNQ